MRKYKETIYLEIASATKQSDVSDTMQTAYCIYIYITSNLYNEYLNKHDKMCDNLLECIKKRTL